LLLVQLTPVHCISFFQKMTKPINQLTLLTDHQQKNQLAKNK